MPPTSGIVESILTKDVSARADLEELVINVLVVGMMVRKRSGRGGEVSAIGGFFVIVLIFWPVAFSPSPGSGLAGCSCPIPIAVPVMWVMR